MGSTASEREGRRRGRMMEEIKKGFSLERARQEVGDDYKRLRVKGREKELR